MHLALDAVLHLTVHLVGGSCSRRPTQRAQRALGGDSATPLAPGVPLTDSLRLIRQAATEDLRAPPSGYLRVALHGRHMIDGLFTDRAPSCEQSTVCQPKPYGAPAPTSCMSSL